MGKLTFSMPLFWQQSIRQNLPSAVDAKEQFRRKGKASALVVAALLLLGGCQGGAGSMDQEMATASSASNQTSQSVSPEGISGDTGKFEDAYASPKTDVPADFPLVPYWDAVRRGEIFIDKAVDVEAVANLFNLRQDALAKCMKAKGFIYFPRDWQRDVASENESGANYFKDQSFLEIPKLPDTREATQKMGYGIEPKEITENAESDRNQEYIDSLSSKEKSAYYLARQGVDITDPSYDPYNRPDTSKGCADRVEKDYPDPSDAFADHNVMKQHWDVLFDITDFSRGGGIFGEKPIIELNRKWRACMAKTDFAPENPSREGGRWDGPYQAYSRAMLTDPSGKVGVPASAGQYELPDEQSRLIGSEPEKKIALLDFDCRAETNYLQVFTDTQRRLEEDFVAKHRKALDAMVAFVDGLS